MSQKRYCWRAEDDQLHILSLDSLEIIKSISISERPTSLAIDSETEHALVTHENNIVTVVDLNTYKIVTEIAVLNKPVSSAVDAGLRLAVIAHQTWVEGGDQKQETTDNVTIINLDTFAAVKTIQVGKNPVHVSINPITHQAVVANEKSNDLSIIDLSTLSVIKTISVQKHPKASSFNVCLNTLSVIGGEEDAPWLQVMDAETWTVQKSYEYEQKLNDIKVLPYLNKAVIADKRELTLRALSNPVPELLSLSPDKTLRGGASFDATLTGKGLMAITEVYLNGSKADATFSSCGSIKVTVPDTYLQTTGKIEIKAVNLEPNGGTSNLIYLSVENPVPVIAALQPTQASAGSAGLTLNVVGSEFFSDSSVYVNGTLRAFTLLSRNQLQTSLTAADLENGGYIEITVSNPQPGGGLSASAKFTIVNPVPNLLAVDPTSIKANSADTTVVLTGDNFVMSTTLSLNGQSVATQFVSKARIEAAIPAALLQNAGTYPLKVINPAPGGGESQVVTLTVAQAGNENVEPLPDGSFGKQYEDLIPLDATIKAYTPKRFAIVTGLVRDRNLNPISDVKVTFLGLPEYGTARTDADGRFNLPVDGGGAITVVFEKGGLITSHRQVNTPWNDIINTETNTMLAEDPKGTKISFDGNPNTVLVHNSTVVTDAFGSRSLTMVFTGDNRATVTDANGQQAVMTTISTRATEFDTPESMPAKLPPTSAYTYCSELSVDGAKNVKFDKPVTVYVDNFIGFNVGEIVPVGYYDRNKGVWMASDNGIVVKLLDTNGDSIVDALDTVGDGQPHDRNVAGLTDPAKFKPNSTYWRVKMDHFTPWDCNWPYGPPSDAIQPNPENDPVVDQHKSDDDTDCTGSYCERRNRIIHEDVPILGTDMTLHYASNRVRGYKSLVTIPASGQNIPASLTKIIVRMEVAGRVFESILPPLPHQKAEFVWDGLDYLGKRVIGSRTADISIGFGYQLVYYSSLSGFERSWERFGNSSTGIRGREDVISWEHNSMTLNRNTFDPIAEGWTLSTHHYLSPMDYRTLVKGDGTTKENDSRIITTVAGNGLYRFSGDNGPAAQASFSWPSGIAVDGAGNIYILDRNNYRIRKVDTNGIITTVAGSGSYGFSGDNGPATQARLSMMGGIAVDGAGNLYIADKSNSRIRKVDTNGIITTVAGNGSYGFSGDNGPATQARLSYPTGIEVDSAGNLYMADTNNGRIRKVDTSGIITTVAGNGSHGFSGDNGPATQAEIRIGWGAGIALDSAGNLYITDMGNSRIRKVDTSGTITTIAGNGSWSFSGDNGPAAQASFYYPIDVATDTAGNIYIADQANHRIRKIDPSGIITTVAGSSQITYWNDCFFSGDGGPAIQAQLCNPMGVATDSVGNIYIADSYNNRIRKLFLLESVTQYSTTGDISFVEENRLLHIMSNTGLHKSTLSLASDKTLRTFAYNAANQLIFIADRFGNQTTIQRDGKGIPTSIVSPDGLATTLTIDSNNHLTQVVYPDGSYHSFGYTPDGLLTDEYDRRGKRFVHQYDSNGRITNISDPDGGSWTYSRSVDKSGNVFSNILTGENNLINYKDRTDSTGAYTSIKTDTTGEITTIGRSSDGLTETTASSCGMKETETYSLDMEYKFKYLSGVATTSPSGLKLTTAYTRAYQDTNSDKKLDLITDKMIKNNNTWMTTNNILTGVVSNTSPKGRSVTSQYDATTLLTKQIRVPGLYSTTFNYDIRGRLVSTTTGSRIISVAYDSKGNISSRTDALGSSMTYTYDSMNRLKRIQAPNADLTVFDYDLNGNMTVLTNPKSVTNLFDYSGNNQRKTWTTPLSGSYQYAYDKERKLKTVMFPSGKVISNTYTGGLLSSATTPEGTITYSYGCGDLLSTATKGAESISFTYDGSLLKTDTRSGAISQTISYTYNNDFNLSSTTYAGITQSFGYDTDGLLTSAGAYAITRNAQNGLPERVNDSTLSLSRAFNGYGEMDENTYAVSGIPLYDWTVTRDNAGRITQKIDNMRGAAIVWAYTYDTFGRLTEAKQSGSVVESYTYDADGNRLIETNTLRGISNKSYSYSLEDHVLSAGADAYQFDKDGFLTSKITSAGTTTYNYSSRGELLSATLADGTVISYDHDPMGRRIAKRVNGTITEKYLWQGLTRLLAVYDADNNLVMRFTYADGRMPVSMTKSGTTYYLAYDQIGSLRAVIDSAGSVIKEVLYDSFGAIIYDNNPAFTVPFGFAGGMHDRDTGLVRFGLRDYDPAIGRWTAKDPIDFAGGDLNLFGYVGNNPVNWIDPWGLYKYSPTAGDPVDDTTGKAMTCFEQCSGLDITITAGKEGGHSQGSKHETGQACDVGKNSNPDLTTDTAKKCFTQCFGPSSYGQEEGNHYHFQTTPGKGGATGFPDGVK